MNQKLNPDQVIAMFKTGFNKKNIAKRLGASEKQIQRILSGYDQSVTHVLNDNLGTSYERYLWLAYFRMLNSFSDVAFRFGVTRQAIQQALALETEKPQ